MSDQPFNNNNDQQTRREVLKDCYLSRAQNDATLEAQGRFKKQTSIKVTGVPTYPKLPDSSPWAKSIDDVVGVEPALSAVGGPMAPTDAPLSDVETSPPKPNKEETNER